MSKSESPPSTPLIVDDHCIVLMHYQLDNGFGDLVDSSRGGLPLTYMHNSGALLPALEREITGHRKGDEFELAIYPEDGYGYRDEALVKKLPRSAIAGIDNLHVGMRVRDSGAGNSNANAGADANADDTILYTVLAFDDDEITVDANHPLAGQVLHFRIAIVDVREPSESELKEYLGEGAVWSPPWLESD